jgi:hypothetical protein
LIVYYNDIEALLEDIFMAIRGFLKTFLPLGWLYGEYEDVKNQNKTIVSIVKSLFIKDTNAKQETFEQALNRLGLTREQADKMASHYRWYALAFLLFGIVLFTYAFYLLFMYFSISGWLLSLAATTLCLAYAFSFDFWSYQIRVRKLGVPFNEWMQSILGGKGSSI